MSDAVSAHVNASVRVKRAIEEAGWPAKCDGLAAVTTWQFKRRGHDDLPYRFVDVLAGDRKVQVMVSPTGRSVRVYVDDTEVPA